MKFFANSHACRHTSPSLRDVSWMRRRRLATTALVSVCILSPLASAQPEMGAEEAQQLIGNVTEMMDDIDAAGVGLFEQRGSVIKRRSLDKIQDMLALDDSQRSLVNEMYRGYRAEVRVYSTKLSDIMKQMTSMMQEVQHGVATGELDQASLMERQRTFTKDLGSASREFLEQSVALEAQFLDDMQLLLSDNQIETMERVNMLRTREKASDQMLISGAAVDLGDVLASIGVQPTQSIEIDGVLRAWEHEIDGPATRMFETNNRVQQGSVDMQEKMMDDPAAGMEFMQKMNEMMDELKGHGIAMRDVNRKYVRLIGDLLDDETRESFDAKFTAESFPSVYVVTNADRTFDAAAGFDDLDTDQREAVVEARGKMERDRDVERAKWARAMEQLELDSDMMTMSMTMMGMGETFKNHRDAVGEVEDAALDRLIRILSEDQRSKLPELTDDSGVSFLQTYIQRAAEDDSEKK